MFYKRLSEQIADKRKCDVLSTYALIKAKLNFSLIRMAVLCIRGTRDPRFKSQDFAEIDVELTLNDANLKASQSGCPATCFRFEKGARPVGGHPDHNRSKIELPKTFIYVIYHHCMFY